MIKSIFTQLEDTYQLKLCLMKCLITGHIFFSTPEYKFNSRVHELKVP